MEALPLEPGQLCHIFLPSMQTMVESLVVNMTSLIDAIFVAVIGDPIAYNVQSTWYGTVVILIVVRTPCRLHLYLSYHFCLLNSITEMLHFTELTSQDLRVFQSKKIRQLPLVVIWAQ